MIDRGIQLFDTGPSNKCQLDEVARYFIFCHKYDRDRVGRPNLLKREKQGRKDGRTPDGHLRLNR